MITYSFWLYARDFTEQRNCALHDVLREAVHDIERNTASPVSIAVDGKVVYDRDAISEAYDSWDWERDTGIVEGSAIVIDEQLPVEGKNA